MTIHQNQVLLIKELKLRYCIWEEDITKEEEKQ